MNQLRIALCALGLLLLGAACDSSNVGGPNPIFFAATINAPTGGSSSGSQVRRLDTVTWSVGITGGTAPYYVAWNFGGAANPDAPIATGVSGSLSTTTVQMVAEGSYTASVSVTDANNVTVANTFMFTVLPPGGTGNLAPTAVLSAVPQAGNVPLNVQFSAAGSADSDGSIVNYEWDLDGDGAYELSGAATTQTRSYTVVGSYTARLRVTDNDGATAVSTLTIVVSAAGSNVSPTAIIGATPVSGAAPLAVNFTAAGSTDPDGSIASYEWDFNGDGTYETNTGTTQTVSFTYTGGGTFSARLRVTDNEGAVSLASITITVTGGAVSPTVTLSALPSSGNAPLSVTFSAAASLAGGTITRYQWDFENDGTFDLDSGTTNTASRTYTVAGTYVARVLVTGSTGTTAADVETIVVGSGIPSGTWTGASTIASGSDEGSYSSMKIVSGNPAIAYYNATNESLYYVRATDALGNSWSTPVLVDGGSSVGGWCALAVIDGRPAISYFDDTNSALKYAYSATVDGVSAADWTDLTVDSGNVGYFTSLAQINGAPAISYRDAQNNNLKYAWSTQANGSSGWASVTVDGSSGWTGAFTSLALVNSRPAVAYNKGNELRYAWSTQSSGSSGWNSLTVDSNGDTGWFCSLAVVDGRPAISYHRYTDRDLRFAWSSTASGDQPGNWSSIIVASTGSVGEYTSLGVAFGRPVISYHNTTTGALNYAYSSSVTGNSAGDWTSLAVGASGADTVGYYSSLAVLGNGYPAISYYNTTDGDLLYTRFE